MRSFEFEFEAIGTHWLINCYESKTPQDKIRSKILARIEEFDKIYSRFRKDSLIWQISKKKGVYEFPPDSKELFNLYEKLYKITDGAFTLLIGKVLSEAGYDANYSLIPRKINKVPKALEVYSFNYPKLTVKKPYILDFGGLGKGYLIDIIVSLLIENGVVSFTIDGGGDIYYQTRERNSLEVGLENPENPKQIIGVVKIVNQSICASSGNRRVWNKYHHIIDARSLTSPKNILATWVIAKNALIADGLATCLFLTSKENLIKYFDFEYLILYPDYSIEKSNNFAAELFYKP